MTEAMSTSSCTPRVVNRERMRGIGRFTHGRTMHEVHADPHKSLKCHSLNYHFQIGYNPFSILSFALIHSHLLQTSYSIKDLLASIDIDSHCTEGERNASHNLDFLCGEKAEEQDEI